MKKILLLFTTLLIATVSFAQINKEKLALDVSKADAMNTEKLKSYIWKRYSSAKVNGEEKVAVVTEFSFNEKGDLEAKAIDAKSNVKKKPGIRGKIQESKMEESADYVQKALELSLAYTFMSKGELIDFMDRAVVTEKDGIIEAVAQDVKVKGDLLTIQIDSNTNLFISKKFTTFLGTDPMSGEVKYAKFNSGVVYGSETVLNLPAKQAVINAVNKDYTIRVQ